MPDRGSLEFGERIVKGDTKIVRNSQSGSIYPPITNREFSEVHDYIVQNSEDGASDPVMIHLEQLFQVAPRKDIDPDNPTYCTIHVQAGPGYNKERFIEDINTAVQFGYTVVEQDTPLRSWTIYYMSIGNNVYCVRYSSTFRTIRVSSRV